MTAKDGSDAHAQKESIIFFGAHNDDPLIGAGGTIARYASQGKRVQVVIFSYGTSSHPWLKEKEIKKTRLKEARKADRVLGDFNTLYLGLSEGRFEQEIEGKKALLKEMIDELKPARIFTHSADDPHPDHRAVNSIISALTAELGYKGEIYSFDIWNPFNIRQRDRPKLIIDITDTFHKKIKALRLHESQWVTLLTMVPATWVRAVANGLDNRMKYAEVFAKLR